MALATSARSPKSCDKSFRYGVSPHPAHAPENSNSGSRNCDPFTSRCTVGRGSSGSVVKNSQLARSRSRKGGCGCISSALRSGFALSLAGQISTQTPQPVQSSGATCRM